MKRYLLIHPEFGVYIGHCMGLGFWSNEETAGQNAACTFALPEEAHEHANSWIHTPDGLTTLPVETDIEERGNYYASVAACVAAGAPGWIDENTPVVGGMQ